ncbi:Hypothetical protein, putative, partial [Bodo saltans]
MLAFVLGGLLGANKSTPITAVTMGSSTSTTHPQETEEAPKLAPETYFHPPPPNAYYSSTKASPPLTSDSPAPPETTIAPVESGKPPSTSTTHPISREPAGQYTSLNHSTRSKPAWVPNFSEYFDPKNERVPRSAIPSRDTKGGHSAMQRGASPYPDFAEERLAVQQNLAAHRSVCKGSWRLPPNQTRFCRSHDGLAALSTSRLRRFDLPERSKLLCDAESPLSITRCSTEECRDARGCLLAFPSPHCQFPSVIVPFTSPSHMDGGMEASASRVFTEPLTAAEASLGTFEGYPVARLQQCADLAMQSYCDHAFQLIPERHAVCSFRGSATSENAQSCHNRSRMLKCVAFRYHHYSRGSLQPLPSQ